MSTYGENKYCMRCSRHLGMPNHETNEHDDAVRAAERQAERARKA
jgi:hypothetical protein